MSPLYPKEHNPSVERPEPNQPKHPTEPRRPEHQKPGEPRMPQGDRKKMK